MVTSSRTDSLSRGACSGGRPGILLTTPRKTPQDGLWAAIKRRLLAGVLLVLSLQAVPCLATATLEAPTGFQSISIGRFVAITQDPTLELRFPTLLAEPNRFARWDRDDLNLGITAQATWIRLQVRNPKDVPVTWYLDMGDGLLDDVTLYEMEPDGRIRSRSTGLQHPWASRDVPLSQIVFALKEPPLSERTIYLRVVSGFGKRLMMRAHTPETLPRVSQLQSMGWGALMGVFAGVGAYHFVLFVLLRDAALFWHSAMMAVALMSRFLIHSFGLESIWPEGFARYGSMNLVFTALIFVCALKFALEVLPLQEISRRWKQLLSMLLWCWVGVLVWAVVWPGAPASMALTLVGLPTQIIVLLAAVAAWRTGSVVARWFLPAWIVLIVGALIWSARNLGWVPVNDWTLVAGSLGLALHTLLLSAGLALRMRDAQREQLHARLQLAEERRVAHQQLERRVQERTAELQSARAEAEALSRTKDLVVRLVSHDLRSPLASIVAASQRVAESPTAAAGIRQTAQGLIRLIDRFLDLDYLRSGALTPRRAWVSAQQLVERQVALLQGLIDAKELNVEIAVPEPAKLFADPALMAEVVANLLSNAIKACGPRGHIRVLWSARPDGLWVEDDGPGFGRSPVATEGHGLGLEHCREILKVHGGVLEIASPTAGARIGFSLPEQGPRALVVDDQPAQRSLIAEALRHLYPGCQVTQAPDGLQAWSILRRDRHDLVVLDRSMPGLDGLGLLGKIRKEPRTQDIPVLILSSVASQEECVEVERACFAAGADGFLAKPLDSAPFEAQIRQLLSHEEDA